MAAQPSHVSTTSPSFCVTCKLAEGAVYPLSMLLMKMLKSVGLSTHHRAHWHPAGYHTADYTPSSTYSSDSCQSTSPSTVHLSSPYFMNLSMWMLQETVLKALYKSRPQISTVFPSPTELVIPLQKGLEVLGHDFPLHKYVLTTPNHLVLIGSGNGFHNYVLPHLPRH